LIRHSYDFLHLINNFHFQKTKCLKREIKLLEKKDFCEDNYEKHIFFLFSFFDQFFIVIILIKKMTKKMAEKGGSEP